jgi:hypothetical protein
VKEATQRKRKKQGEGRGGRGEGGGRVPYLPRKVVCYLTAALHPHRSPS